MKTPAAFSKERWVKRDSEVSAQPFVNLIQKLFMGDNFMLMLNPLPSSDSWNRKVHLSCLSPRASCHRVCGGQETGLQD